MAPCSSRSESMDVVLPSKECIFVVFSSVFHHVLLLSFFINHVGRIQLRPCDFVVFGMVTGIYSELFMTFILIIRA